MLFSAPAHKRHCAGRVWQQVQLHKDILVSELRASLLPLAAERLKHVPQASKPAVSRSELKVHAGLRGLRMDSKCLQSCYAAFRALLDLRWLQLRHVSSCPLWAEHMCNVLRLMSLDLTKV